MRNPLKAFILGFSFILISQTHLFGQEAMFEFGQEVGLEKFTADVMGEESLNKLFNVNTECDTWSYQDSILVCKGLPIGVIRSEKQYENFIMHVEWRHMEAGGKSGTFIWSSARPGENKL